MDGVYLSSAPAMAIEELAATWDTTFDAEEKEDHEEGQS